MSKTKEELNALKEEVNSVFALYFLPERVTWFRRALAMNKKLVQIAK